MGYRKLEINSLTSTGNKSLIDVDLKMNKNIEVILNKDFVSNDNRKLTNEYRLSFKTLSYDWGCLGMEKIVIPLDPQDWGCLGMEAIQ